MNSNTSESIRKSFKEYKDTIKEEAVKTDSEILSYLSTKTVSVIKSAVSGDIKGLFQDVGGALSDGLVYAFQDAARKIKAGEQATQIASYIRSEVEATESDLKQIGKIYAELSQKVGPKNINLSLTTQEYAEFISLQNQLGQMFPSLITDWDSQGNVILNLKGNVEEVTAALDDLMEKQKQAANSDILDQFYTAYTGVMTKIKGLRHDKELLQNELDHYTSTEQKKIVYTDEGVPYEVDMETGQATVKKKLSRHATKEEGKTDLIKYLESNDISYAKKTERLSPEHSFEVFDFELTPEQDAENKRQIAGQVDAYLSAYQQETGRLKAEIDDINKQIFEKQSTLKPFFEAMLNDNFYYSTFDEPMQKIARSMVNSIDFQAEGIDADNVDEYINENILKPLYEAAPEAQDAFSQLLSMESGLSNGEISTEEFSNQVTTAFTQLFENMDNEDFKNRFIESMQSMGIEGESLEQIIEGISNSWSILAQQELPSADPIAETAEALEECYSKLNYLNSAYQQASSIAEEYNRTGVMSIDMLTQLTANGGELMKYLDYENGKLVVNEAAMKNAALAELDKIIANEKLVQESIIEDLTKENNAAVQTANSFTELSAKIATTAAAQAMLNAENFAANPELAASLANNEAYQASLNRQKAAEALRNDILNGKFTFSSSGGGSRYSGGSSGSASSVDTWLEAYDKAKADLDHRRKMGVISEEDYLNELTALNDKYFKDREKYHDQYRDNLVEIRGLEESLTKEKIADIDEEISALEKEENTYDDQLDLVYQQRDAINAAIEDARAKGYDTESEYYKSLEKLMDENLEKEKSIIDARREYEQEAFLEGLEGYKDRIASYKDQEHGEISGELMVEEADAALQKIQERIDQLRREDAKANKEEIEKLEDEYDELYDSRLEGLQMILDAEKKQIDESISAAKEALEEERAATEEYYNEEIKAYKRKHEEQEVHVWFYPLVPHRCPQAI